MNLTTLEKEAMQAVHPDECECGECDAALLVIQWQDLSIGQEKTVRSVCYRKHNVDIGCRKSGLYLSTDGGLSLLVKPDWPVSRIYQVASRMQEAERMILALEEKPVLSLVALKAQSLAAMRDLAAHDAACFCAECLTKPKEDN